MQLIVFRSTEMAFLSKSAPLIFVAAFCVLFVLQLQPSADCNMESGCFYVQAAAHHREMHNRKLLNIDLEGDKVVFKSEEVGNTGGKGTAAGGGWELREAPLGPDPLHHHGGSPSKKPITP